MKVGRPKTTHCKRGHERPQNTTGYAKCMECVRLKYRMKYADNEEFRERKKKQVREYKRAFHAKYGYWPQEKYDRKPKSSELQLPST